MKKRGLLVKGIVILVLLLLWMKFQTTDTFVLLFHPEEYFVVEKIEEESEDIVPDDVRNNVDITNGQDYDIESKEFQLDEFDVTEVEETLTPDDFTPEPEQKLNEGLVEYSKYYGYSNINENLKLLYMQIYNILLSRSTNVEIDTISVDEIQIAFQCVVQDHPELFYVEGYVYSMYKYGETIDSITFSGKYFLDEEEIVSSQMYIDEYVTQFLSGITNEMDMYERVKAAYEYIILNTTYDLNSSDNQNIRSVFIYRKSVCQGYAKAFQYLLQTMDISCMLVTGFGDGEAHAWNLVKIDDAYYYVDSTWGEANIEVSSDGLEIQGINYNYLNVTTEEISKNHIMDSPISLPYCTAIDANYYVREGTYFIEFDTSRLSNVFNNAYANGNSQVTLKCANEYVYQDLLNHLFTNKKLFEYIQSSQGKVQYATDDAMLTISVYL